jgi:two-component system response regulator DesR
VTTDPVTNTPAVPATPWRTVLLDPDRLTRLAMAALLGSCGLPVGHNTEDPVEAERSCQERGVGVLVSELVLPGTTLTELAARVRAARPNLRIVVLTSEEDPSGLVRAVEAGACAVLSKFSDPAATVARVAATSRGGLLLDEITAPLVLGGAHRAEPAVHLTEKEAAVLNLVAEGRTLHAVSRELNVAESTVKSHAAKAAARLGARNSRDAARIAANLGLLVAKVSVLVAGLLQADSLNAFSQTVA